MLIRSYAMDGLIFTIKCSIAAPGKDIGKDNPVFPQHTIL